MTHSYLDSAVLSTFSYATRHRLVLAYFVILFGTFTFQITDRKGQKQSIESFKTCVGRNKNH